MAYDNHIEEQIKITKSFLLSKFNCEVENSESQNDFIKLTLKCIFSIKIWNDFFEKEEITFNGTTIYIKEIISNLNQSLILSLLGFKIPAYVMIRRSQENILSFLYYKDHYIEFLKREYDSNKKTIRGLGELKDYIKDYPFQEFYTVNSQKIQEFIKSINEEWSKQYKELSHYVHGSNSTYCDLYQYLDDINFDHEVLNETKKHMVIFGSIFNTLMIIYFYSIYDKFDENQKSFIRKVIINELEYKSKLIDIFDKI